MRRNIYALSLFISRVCQQQRKLLLDEAERIYQGRCTFAKMGEISKFYHLQH